MTKPLRTEFVIADGMRARWVERSRTANDFVTVHELTAQPQPAGHPQGVVFEGGSGQRFTTGPHGHDTQHKEADRFAHEVAQVINARVAKDGSERIALVAPPRMLNEIRSHLSTSAGACVAQTLAKDLTHMRDHELGAWLRSLELV